MLHVLRRSKMAAQMDLGAQRRTRMAAQDRRASIGITAGQKGEVLAGWDLADVPVVWARFVDR